MGTSAGIGIVVLDAEGSTLVANSDVPTLLGLANSRPGTVLTRATLGFPPRVQAAIEDAITHGRPASLRAVHSATSGPLDWRIAPRVDPTNHQVTEVLVAFAEPSSPTSLAYQAFAHSTDAIQITDRAGVIVDVNPAFERIYGYTRQECLGKTPRIVKSPKTPRAIYTRMWQDLLDPAIGRWSGELTNVDKSGNEHRVLLNIDAIRDEAGVLTHFMGVASDVSARRALEQRAAHTEKLAALGNLAAGVAHELNTPLANILLLAENLHRRTKDPGAKERLATLMTQVETASHIVAGLLDFSRQHEPQFANLDMTVLVRDALAFLHAKQPAGVRVEADYDSSPLFVLGDRDQLTQLVVNITSNAIDAVAGNGVVRVAVRGDTRSIRLLVSDTGPGIPPQVMPRIFEPFFTTKAEGKGTGLGLAICYGIAQSHGGVIEAASPPGSGATFTVRLPRGGLDP